MCAPYAVNVQLKVTMSGPDGKRYKADFARILDILDKSSYRGYIALEYEDSEEPKEAVPRLIEELQKMIG
jgi:sugar phosphate isomerase/epimerase